MKYFPINLDIRGRKVLVVGGGQVALRKVKSLKACGARVTVVSPAFCTGLVRMKGIKRKKHAYKQSDLRGVCLVVSATDDGKVNRRVWKQAVSKNIPVNVVDQPALCTFTVPAVATRGDLVITISTGGGSPALARKIRKHIEKNIDPTVAQHLKLLKEMRPKVLSSPLAVGGRTRLLKRMAGDFVCRILRSKGAAAAKRYLQDMLKKSVGK